DGLRLFESVVKAWKEEQVNA
ncbi:hypothetical protein ACR73N_08470, partial [Listeria monocytogenes]